GDIDPGLRGDLLHDQRLRKEGRKEVGRHRLLRPGMERRQRLDPRPDDPRHDVEPRRRDLVGLEVEGRALAHAASREEWKASVAGSRRTALPTSREQWRTATT